MNYHTELTDKYLQSDEELLWSGKPIGYKDNLVKVTVVYLALVLIAAGVVAWIFPEKTFTIALGVGFFGMFLVFIWAFFMIKRQSQNKADIEDLFYAITENRIIICSQRMKKMLKEYHFAAITHAFIESEDILSGTVYFSPNANTQYTSSKISGFFIYSFYPLDSSRLFFVSHPNEVCEIINSNVANYEKKMKNRGKKSKAKES